MINVLIPMAYCYHQAHGKSELAELVENGLLTINAEKNKIVTLFETMGILAENAMQSQGIIQLKKCYCDEKRCLSMRSGLSVAETRVKGVCDLVTI